MISIKHKAPFNLRHQNSFFGGWPVVEDTDDQFAIAITFPVEGWDGSAAVVVKQTADGKLTAEAYGSNIDSEVAINQALATLSLNINDTDWEDVGKKDTFIAELQVKYDFLRPVLFHSPYEAAAGFVIGQRISIKQRQAIQERLAKQYGDKINVDGQTYYAFPRPDVLLKLTEESGLNENKLHRLHGIANATLAGKLDREYLLSLPVRDALDELTGLNGIGPFYASGILYRGAGIVDDVTDDSLTKYAIMKAYNLKKEPNQKEVRKIAENWRPYRMWCEVLIHIWLRREVGMPKKRF